MARKRKPSGKLWRGPFTFDHLRQVVEEAGFERCTGEKAGTNHSTWEHPETGEKVPLSDKWDGVKKGHAPFNSVADRMGISGRELLKRLQDVDR